MVETVKTYAARRRLRLGAEFRDGPRRTTDPVTVEHLVPEAHLWFRVESLLHTGQISEVEVPVQDLFAAFELREVSSVDCLAILERLGLKDGVSIQGPHKSPRRPSPLPPRKAAADVPEETKTGPGTMRRRERPVAPAAPGVPKKAAKKAAPKTKAVPKKTTSSRKGAGTAVLVPLRTEVES